MFHPELKATDVLAYAMQDSTETLRRMEAGGFPVSASPPHSMSVMLITDSKNPDYVALGRSDPQVLSDIPMSEWAMRSLFELDTWNTNGRHPIGAFYGLIMCQDEDEPNREDLPQGDIFVGILQSPTGEEVVAAYAHIEDLDDVKPLWTDPRELLEFLNTHYTPADPSVTH